jgi:hypothetical protein
MRTLQLLLAVGCVVALSGFAFATTDTLTVKYTNVSPGITTGLSVDFNGDGHADVSYGSVSTGVCNLSNDVTRATGSGVTISDLLGSNIHAFCIDIRQSVPGSYSLYNVIDLPTGPIGDGNTAMGVARANQIRELFGRFYATSFTNNQAAAFQAAIWEIENEGTCNPLNVSTGNALIGQGNATMQAIANQYLSALTGNELFFDYNVRAIGNDCRQDFVFTVPGIMPPGGPPVPEPITMGAIALALGGLGVYVRKRTKAPRQAAEELEEGLN